MPKMRLLLLLAALCGFVSLCAVEPAAADPPATDTAAAAATPAPPPALSVLIAEFCKNKEFTPTPMGAGPFRAMQFGPSGNPDLEKHVGLGCEALARLERWSGNPKAFIPEVVDGSSACWMLLIKDEGMFNEWVDFGRSKGAIKPAENDVDLAKKLKGFAMPGAMVSTADRLNNIGANFAVYSAACVSLDRIAAANGRRRLPAWLREGLASELQRELAGSPRCTTISYQTNDSKEATTDNWMADVKAILREKKAGGRAMTADQVLNSTTDLISPSTFRQMWSLCTFLRVISDTSAKPKTTTKFWAVIEATAKGTDSMEAIKTIYGITPANLDTAWNKWANAGIAPPIK